MFLFKNKMQVSALNFHNNSEGVIQILKTLFNVRYLGTPTEVFSNHNSCVHLHVSSIVFFLYIYFLHFDVYLRNLFYGRLSSNKNHNSIYVIPKTFQIIFKSFIFDTVSQLKVVEVYNDNAILLFILGWVEWSYAAFYSYH